MKHPARIGAIGAGYWGANIVRNLWEMGVLAAVCDADLRRLDEVRSQYPGVRLYVDADQMLGNAKLDGVAIAAPAAVHAQMALRVIAAGKHVFVEKPLALSVRDAERVVEASEAAGVTLFVGHVLLYHPGVAALLDAVAAGKIGRVRHVRSRRLSWGRLRAHENVWWSFAPHDCALMLALLKERPIHAAGRIGEFVRPGVADFTYADFAFASGRSAHIEVSWLDPDKSSRVDVFGSEGTLTFLDSREGGSLRFVPCGDRLGLHGEPELWKGDRQEIEYPRGVEPLRLELQAFVRALRGNATFPTDGREGLEVVRALHMVAAESSAPPVSLEALA